MGDLPSGSVTFLFSDIEGSTRLVKTLRDRYPSVLGEHQRLVRDAIAKHAGHEIDTQGDSFFVAFATAKQAVLCALDAQRALTTHTWPEDGRVRIRVGIHTGQAVPTGDNYTGLAVHRASRICNIGQGGQVLISQATQTLLEDEEEDLGIELIDLGERRLKDLDRPVRLYQLAAPGLEREFRSQRDALTPAAPAAGLQTPNTAPGTDRVDPPAQSEIDDADTESVHREFRRRLRRVVVIAAGLVAAGLALAAYETNFMRLLELDTVDARFSVRGPRTPPANLVIVQIDDETFSDLGIRWPFPRSLHADLIRRISQDKPLVIAYDIQFTERTVPREDNALIQAVAGADGRVVLGTGIVDNNGGTNVFGGDAVLRRIRARVGNTAIPPDPGGVLRRLPYQVDKLKSFAIVSAEVALGRPIKPDTLGGRAAWIDFYGPPGTVPAVSFSRVLEGKLRRGFFTGRVVVVGASAPSLQDVHATSISSDRLMAGPEIEANAISTALSGFSLRSGPRALDLALITLLGLLVPAASLRFRLGVALLMGLGCAGLFALATQLAFNHGWILSFVYPLAALAASAVAVLGARYAVAVAEIRAARARPGELPLGGELGGYRLERVLGRGGGGTVYLAMDSVLRRQIALKVLNPELVSSREFRRRFLQESQLAAALDHPNVVPIYRAGEENDRLYLAMRYVRSTLADLLRRDAPLGVEQALTIVGQIGDALDAAHAAGLIHRDVTPSNILLDTPSVTEPYRHAYLADFGLTKHRGLTSVMGRVGAPDYVAPEQIRGEPIDGRADLYSLACVLYECLVGAPPFAANSEASVIGGHLSRTPPPVGTSRNDVHPQIDVAIVKALAKLPEERYDTCGEFVAAAGAAGPSLLTPTAS